MSGILWAPIRAVPESLMIIDSERRLYAALRTDGDAYHVIQPAGLDDPRVGDGKVVAGELVCTCPGGVYRGDCWALRAAAVIEGSPDPGPIPWMDTPAGAGERVEAFRG